MRARDRFPRANSGETRACLPARGDSFARESEALACPPELLAETVLKRSGLVEALLEGLRAEDRE